MSKQDPNTITEEVVADPNATEPESQVVKGQNGGKRPGAGRPKGSKNQFSKHSVDRLKELNFDPMESMVDLYWETSQIIAEMDDQNHPRRYSAPAMASLLINKQKIVNDLCVTVIDMYQRRLSKRLLRRSLSKSVLLEYKLKMLNM